MGACLSSVAKKRSHTTYVIKDSSSISSTKPNNNRCGRTIGFRPTDSHNLGGNGKVEDDTEDDFFFSVNVDFAPSPPTPNHESSSSSRNGNANHAKDIKVLTVNTIRCSKSEEDEDDGRGINQLLLHNNSPRPSPIANPSHDQEKRQVKLVNLLQDHNSSFWISQAEFHHNNTHPPTPSFFGA